LTAGLPRSPRAVLLDALGTLVELEPPAARLRRELKQRLGLRVDQVTAQRAIAAEIAYYRRHLDEGRDAASLAALRQRCAAVVCEALTQSGTRGVPGPAQMTETLLASLRFRRFPDAVPALTELRRRRIKTLVVSNWDISLHAVLERLGVARLVGGVLTSAEAGARKPSPEIFARALATLGVSAGAALHVGDNLDEDIAGARAAGIEPVLISRRGRVGREDVPQVVSLTELVERLP
jgi:putative hydrolase of the HAD superfamily